MGQNSNCVSVYVGFFFDGVFSVLRLFLAATIFFYSCSVIAFEIYRHNFCLVRQRRQNEFEPTAGLFCVRLLAGSRASVRTRLCECLYDFVCLAIYFAWLQFASLPKYFVECECEKGTF